jgi:hypothetical protein
MLFRLGQRALGARVSVASKRERGERVFGSRRTPSPQWPRARGARLWPAESAATTLEGMIRMPCAWQSVSFGYCRKRSYDGIVGFDLGFRRLAGRPAIVALTA